MTFYSEMQGVANELLTEFGDTWTLRRVNKGTYNPSTNTRTTDSTDNYSVKCVRQNYKNNQIDGENIQNGDILLLVDAYGLEITPDTTDIFINSSETWQIVNIELIKPGDTIVMYKIQVRQ